MTFTARLIKARASYDVANIDVTEWDTDLPSAMLTTWDNVILLALVTDMGSAPAVHNYLHTLND